MLYGERHVGGGPASTAPDGTPLADLPVSADPSDPFTHSYAPALGSSGGQASVWEWSESGTEEMNCFLCHLNAPDTEARAAELAAGRFGWANTATLANTGIVVQGIEDGEDGEAWAWNLDAFTPEGELASPYVGIQNPTPGTAAPATARSTPTPPPLSPATSARTTGTPSARARSSPANVSRTLGSMWRTRMN